MSNQVLIGDCAEVLKSFPDESIDLIVTDPPYGISFMGKEWDKALPTLEALKECNRVLKAGAFGFFMCAPRMDVLWRMGQRLEEAGFRVDFSSMIWAQSQGFPKAQATDKLIDKRLGIEPIKLSPKPYTNDKSIQNNSYGKHGYERTQEYYTKPATPEAQEFQGSFVGFQPKPCVEIIIVAMKQRDKSCKTYVDQALQNGHGCTWLDSVRIPCEAPHHDEAGRVSGKGWSEQGGSIYYSNPDGRFPANLLCSDNCLDNGIITKSNSSGKVDPLRFKKYKEQDGTERKTFCTQEYKPIHDSGSFSRYFSLDAWFDKKIQELPEHIQKTFPFLIVPKPSKSEKNRYIENKHPTVKPLKLMSYLITMGSREGDTILDPYAGSGTTLEACRLLNRVFVGIDKDPENEKYMLARSQLDTPTLDTYEEAA